MLPVRGSLLRIRSAQRLAPLSTFSFLRTAVSCRQSAVTFVTVAPSQQSSRAASPTRPLNDKIRSRARLLAGHLESTTSSRAFASTNTKTSSTMSYTTRKVGAANTLEHRVYIEKDGQLVSPWHDIPLYANEQQTVLNMVVEVPRWTNAKMEVRTPQLTASRPSPKHYTARCRLTVGTDLQGGAAQPHQAGHEEGQAPLRPQLLPPQRLPLELRCLPSGAMNETRIPDKDVC